MKQTHAFHLVDPSPWPAVTSLGALITALGLVMYFHQYNHGGTVLSFGLFLVVYTVFLWWRDVIRESTVHHTYKVQAGIESGMILFIVTEAMFFFGLLWTFIHLASQPSFYVGTQWPPAGIIPVDWSRRPLLNTALLFTSYFTANMAMYAVEAGSDVKKTPSMLTHAAFVPLSLTVFLGLLFVFYQYLEYSEAAFTISDSAFGSIFYLATGFHGFHVLLGAAFLLVCLVNLAQTSSSHCLGLRLAVLYWHFVDLVWIFLLGIIYYWGSSEGSLSS
jgi:cytochrome c oxidase subunit 3